MTTEMQLKLDNIEKQVNELIEKFPNKETTSLYWMPCYEESMREVYKWRDPELDN